MAFITTTAASISSGGTINGDITITGDLKVEGAGSFAFDEIIEGTQVIEKTDTEAFLVRKASDGGDVFVVDTTNSRIGIGVTPSNIASFASGNRTLELIMADSADTGNVGVQFRAGASDYLGFAGGGGTGVGIVIHSDNNVGIGANPSTNLDIYDADGATLRLRGDADGDVKTIEFGTSSAQYHKITSNANTGIMQIGGFSGSGMVLHLSADGNVRMKIDNNSRISLSNNDSSGTTTNTVFGRLAGANGTMGSNNAFFGDAVANNTLTADADNNVGVGYRALHMLTSGANNVAVGYQSLLDITTGNYNTMLGVSAGANSTTGSYNTAVGYQAMYGNDSTAQTGDQSNIAMGYRAMYAITTATNCVALGANALDAMTAGDANIAIGRNALVANTTGGFNNALGSSALAANDNPIKNNINNGPKKFLFISPFDILSPLFVSCWFFRCASIQTKPSCSSSYNNRY